MEVYESPSRHRITSVKIHRRKAVPKSRGRNLGPMPAQGCIESRRVNPLFFNGVNTEGGQTDCSRDAPCQQDATKLSSLRKRKDRLRGQSLRFDIPGSLDDTVARFIMAVALRYKFESPGESYLHGNFELASVKKGHQQKCIEYAEPLIHRLHEMGIIFIRQFLPAENMVIMLAKMGVSDEFLVISNSLVNVLHQISGGNYLNRRYLMAETRHLVDTQKQLQIVSLAAGEGYAKLSNQHDSSLCSFLGECGAAGSDDYNDDDNPGGLWTPKVMHLPETQGTCMQVSYSARSASLPQTSRETRNKSWVTSYTAKIISENESKHPALGLYRHGKLLRHG